MRDVLERIFIGLSEVFERIYYTGWGCKHGKHRMKFSGCMYCGQTTDHRLIRDEWNWKCFDCNAQGKGTEDQVRHDSTQHLLRTGHAVTGSEK